MADEGDLSFALDSGDQAPAPVAETQSSEQPTGDIAAAPVDAETAPPADGEAGEQTEQGTTETAPEEWTKAAALDERRKRQELSSQLQQTQIELARLQGHVGSQGQPQQPAEPEYTDDAYYGAPVDTTKRIVGDMLSQRDGVWQQRLLAMSQHRVKQLHPKDYDDAIRSYVAAAQSNPALNQSMLGDPEPAEFAYNYGKQLMQLGELGEGVTTIDELKEQMRKELRPEIEAELKKKRASDAVSGQPPTNAGARGAPVNAAQDDVPDLVFPLDGF